MIPKAILPAWQNHLCETLKSLIVVLILCSALITCVEKAKSKSDGSVTQHRSVGYWVPPLPFVFAAS